MKPLTIVLLRSSAASFASMLSRFASSPLTDRTIIVHPGGRNEHFAGAENISTEAPFSGRTVSRILERTRTEYLLLVPVSEEVDVAPSALDRLVSVARQTGSGLTYADYYETKSGARVPHPLNEYQAGSVRDAFEFGPLMLFSMKAVRRAVARHGSVEAVRHAALYDLRLKVSVDHALFHVQEFLCAKASTDPRKSGEKLFDYVDPRNRIVQKEMEKVATNHLKRVGAYLTPRYSKIPQDEEKYPVDASVVIPVRNRKRTIGDAVMSALSQQADVPYNVLVVDNHSTDGTTDVLRDLATRHSAVRHLIPSRSDLGIGGCWEEAVRSPSCGRFAVQLDSDDIYSGPTTLQQILDVFRQGDYGMVVGSYRLVNMNLEEIPPGVVDHREWTPANGRNNALRINGFGAPRAFRTSLLRKVGIPNVSYGEDYAVSLRISREYRVGRIFEPIYLCRRWEGNSDSSLTVEQTNRNDAYKDHVRTIEILARRRMNAGRG
ncbi:MAG TPA: glycosyltransferase family A protein [Bacteroidota bacterium]|nr:glycosyltransferase family A protein [Bacteroidota bacterium]